MAKTITVPKTPASAYDPSRRVSSLLKAHVDNLEAIVRRRSGLTPARKPRTERQAAEYIAELTRQLHPADEYAPAPPVLAVVPAAAVPAIAVVPATPRAAAIAPGAGAARPVRAGRPRQRARSTTRRSQMAGKAGSNTAPARRRSARPRKKSRAGKKR